MCLIPGLGTYLLYARWLKPPLCPFGAKPLVRALLWALWLMVPLGPTSWHMLNHSWLGPLTSLMSWLGYFWLGILFYATLAIGLSAVALWLLRLFRPPSLRLRQRVAALGALAVAGICSHGLWVVAQGPQVLEREVVLQKLSPAFEGFSVALISDIHLGPTQGRRFSERVVAQLNALEADVVAIVGDLVDGSVKNLAHAVAPFKNLRAKHGVLFVTGNHEYFMGAAQWVEHLEGLGFRVLGNASVEIERPLAEAAPARLVFAGVHDLFANRTPSSGHQSNLGAALANREAHTPVVLLSHQPNLWKEAQAAGVDLMLSGHTHGGQLWPFHHMVQRLNPTLKGLYREGASQLYVSSGTGQWGPPLRVGAPPEITLLRLRAPALLTPR